MPTHEFGPGFPEGVERGLDGGLHWFGFLPMLLLAVSVGVIVWAVIRLTRDGGLRAFAGGGGTPGTVAPGRPDAALEELRLRYARGEMTRDDYADRLHDLTTATATPGPSTGGSPEQAPPPDA
jgi:uncharacterized membrane protein